MINALAGWGSRGVTIQEIGSGVGQQRRHESQIGSRVGAVTLFSPFSLPPFLP